MSFLSRLRDRAANRFPGSRTDRCTTIPRCRPQLEVLEGRDVPSTLTVTNNLDNGTAGSLRYEIGVAQSGDTIVFSPSLKGATITLSGNELYLNKSLDIEGLGAKNLAISGGSQSARVFEIAAVDALGQRVQATLAGMTIENGYAYVGGVAWNGSNYYGQGGGILNFGTLTVSGCTVTGNSATFGGGGIANELGGTMTISGCTVSHNDSTYDNGIGGYGGGGIYNDGTMTLSGSSVIQNTGYGVWNDSNGVLTILNSSVKSNKPGDLYNLGTYSVDSSSTIG